MKSVTKEELVHAGEFLKLLEKVSPEDKKLFMEGQKEAEE